MLNSETARSAPPHSTALLPLDRDGAELAAGWLGQRENYQWLDFGCGRQQLSASALRAMSRSPKHLIRLFASGDGPPIGLVALSEDDDDRSRRLLWFLLGDKSHYGRGLTTRAVGQVLALAFASDERLFVHAWTVDINLAARRVLERNGFRLVDRRPRSHQIDGCALDRLVFQLTRADAVLEAGRAGAGGRGWLDPGPAEHDTGRA